MMLFETLLSWAAGWNMTPVVAATLAAAPPTASFARAKDEALHTACYTPVGYGLRCLRLLLAAGADPNAPRGRLRNQRAIHVAALHQKPACVAVLLAAGADPLALDSDGQTACHLAADAATVRLLLAAAPQAALVRCSNGRTPVETALYWHHWQAAQCLAAEAQLPSRAQLVSCLRSTIQPLDEHCLFLGLTQLGGPASLQGLLLLVPILVARLDLAPSDFTQQARHHSLMVSSQLGRWLPAMMEHSEAAAARLVAFLPPADRRWLRTLALSLGRYERSLSAQLPPPILRRLLVLAAVQHAQHLGRWRHRMQRFAEAIFTAVGLSLVIWLYFGAPIWFGLWCVRKLPPLW